jgi:superfamily II DNA or RNA helicase
MSTSDKPLSLLQPSDLHPYQRDAIRFICSNTSSMIWLDPGMGKTAISLTAIVHLLSVGFLRGVLVVAPLRVAESVWIDEIEKWAHLNHLTVSKIIGNEATRVSALRRKANIYIINYEGVPWLSKFLDQYYIKMNTMLPFNGAVFDEVTMVKDPASNRSKAFNKIFHHFQWLVGLTGTPSSNTPSDLTGQYLAVDGGKRLGATRKAFEKRFLKCTDVIKIKDYYNLDENGNPKIKREIKKYSPEEHTIELIRRAVKDITIELSAKDYLQMPDFITNDIVLHLPKDIQQKYDELEDKMWMEFDSGFELQLQNRLSFLSKGLQFASGWVYTTNEVSKNRPIEEVHEMKLDALEELLEGLNGKPALLAYWFRPDANRIMKRFKDLNPINYSDCKTKEDQDRAKEKFRNGECRLIIGNPKSIGHGLDGLQKTSNTLIWYGIVWSFELFKQFNARLWRQGSSGAPVVCHRILMADTVEDIQRESLQNKQGTEEDLKNALSNSINEYRARKNKKPVLQK